MKPTRSASTATALAWAAALRFGAAGAAGAAAPACTASVATMAALAGLLGLAACTSAPPPTLAPVALVTLAPAASAQVQVFAAPVAPAPGAQLAPSAPPQADEAGAPTSAQILTLKPGWTQLRLPTALNAPPPGPLVCPQRSPAQRPPAPAPSAATAPPAAPPTTAQALVMPDEEDVQASLQALRHGGAGGAGGGLAWAVPQDALGRLTPRQHAAPLRVAIWGDSHLAAGFFTEALVRQLGLQPAQVRSSYLPASVQRAGVRLPQLRGSCVSAGWKYESAHAQPTAEPGPGLVNMLSQQSGAWLALDLRAPGNPPQRRLRLLYEQSAQPIELSLRADGGAEQRVRLAGAPGPAVLELLAEAPIAQIHLKLESGTLRWHGLALDGAAPATGEAPNGGATRLQLDASGYPGATLRGWQLLDVATMRNWFAPDAYDLVALAYGTNEANDPGFEPQAYQRSLRQAVQKLRQTFPQAACLLIAPPDRGILVPASSRRRGAKAGHKTALPDLLRFARLHAQVGQAQHKVASEFGCKTWSMQTAMGGPGGAYAWARQKPSLMAPDLLHLSVPGYQKLGQQLARDWMAKP